MYKIVIDMMGSDNGSKYTVMAVKEFLKEHSDVHFICVGKIEQLSELGNHERVELVDAREVVQMDADPFEAIKAKEASMIKAFRLVKEQKYDAVVSFGGSAAFLTAATLILGRIKGVKRPCFATQFPRVHDDKFTTLLDVGANKHNSPEELVQFAQMGMILNSTLYNNENPKVTLLSNGAEEHKGTDEIVETHKLLKEMNAKWFIGNFEPNQLLFNTSDVVVCDGFNGNIMLKSYEGCLKAVSKILKEGFGRNLRTKIGYLFAKPFVKDFKKKFSFKTLSGAMVLGANAMAVKGHGGSDFDSTYGAFSIAYNLVSKDVMNKIRNEFIKE